MTLIVCVDDHEGMAFHERRQSRDRAVCQDMLALAGEHRLWISEKSNKLFAGLDGSLAIDKDWTEKAAEDEFCFVETNPLRPLEPRVTQLVLYRWNRIYPADLYFDLSLEDWQQISVTEFPGTSHERITREVYIRA